MIYLKLGPSDRVKINCLMCQVLLWSRGKSLYEVRKFLGRPNPEKFEEIQEERKNSLLDEKIDIFSKEELFREISFQSYHLSSILF